MSNIPVRKIRETKDVSLFDQIDRIFDEVRRKAFALFEQRGGETGRDLDDWLRAERELLWAPPAELVEKDTEFRTRIAAPGFEAKDIQITVLPDSIVIEAESSHKEEEEKGAVHFSDFRSRRLFRRVELPSPIDVDRVTATLEKGVLRLVAAKAAQPQAKKVAVAGR